MFNMKKIRKLEEELSYCKQTCNELKDKLTEVNNKNIELRNMISQKNEEILNLEHVNTENEIMRKYYKLDEEPSPEVQAKVFVDLRIHDMEYKNIIEKIGECRNIIDRMGECRRFLQMYYPYYSNGLHPYF